MQWLVRVNSPSDNQETKHQSTHPVKEMALPKDNQVLCCLPLTSLLVLSPWTDMWLLQLWQCATQLPIKEGPAMAWGQQTASSSQLLQGWPQLQRAPQPEGFWGQAVSSNWVGVAG